MTDDHLKEQNTCDPGSLSVHVSAVTINLLLNYTSDQVHIVSTYNFIGASTVTQTVKSLPATWKTRVLLLGWEDPLEKGMATPPLFLGFPCGSASKETACREGDLGSIPCSGRFPWRS